MGLLAVPGAQLYYKTYGDGPLLLMIHGADGTSEVFNAVAAHLSKRYSVTIYDRRGYSRSKLDGLQRETSFLNADAEDVCHLIEHLSDLPAIVFGSSSGAIVALEAFARNPSAIRTLVTHEPPLMMMLPEGQKWSGFLSDIYNLYRSSGVKPAMDKFFEVVAPRADRRAISSTALSDNALSNSTHWFEHELRQYPSVKLNLDILRAHADGIFPVAGRKSRGQPAYGASAELARKLGRNLIELPGGHVGFRTQPQEFARELMKTLAFCGP